MRNSLFPFIVAGIILSLGLSFQSCEPKDDDENIDPDPIDCDSCMMAYKPNIYIYPIETIQLNLTISFPLGGEVIASIPDYGAGWNVSVDATGIIDDSYSFLFYESIQPNVWQFEKAWLINKTELRTFFNENMTSYGFEGQEIRDFIDYWYPRLNSFTHYAIYPQTSEIIEEVIQLNFSEEPDNILRLFYVIEGCEDPLQFTLSEPEINTEFIREGYFVTEWGVIRK